MTKLPKIKARDLNKKYLEVYFSTGAQLREQLAKDSGIDLTDWDEEEYAAFEEYFYGELDKATDEEFAKRYGQHNLTRLTERSKRVILPMLIRFYARRISLPASRMRSRLRHLLAYLLTNQHSLAADENDLPDLPF